MNTQTARFGVRTHELDPTYSQAQPLYIALNEGMDLSLFRAPPNTSAVEAAQAAVKDALLGKLRTPGRQNLSSGSAGCQTWSSPSTGA